MVSEHDSATHTAILSLFFDERFLGLIFCKKIGVGIQRFKHRIDTRFHQFSWFDFIDVIGAQFFVKSS